MLEDQPAIIAALPELKEALRYDPKTGHFFWKPRNPQPRRVRPGDIAGTIKPPDNRIQINFTFKNGRRLLFRAHRLAYWFMTGEVIPDGFHVDHINGNPSDNRWENLRLVTPGQSNMNMPVRADNRSGHRGIWWFAKANKWYAYLNVKGRRRYLGLFATMEEAVAARVAAEEKYFGKYNRS